MARDQPCSIAFPLDYNRLTCKSLLLPPPVILTSLLLGSTEVVCSITGFGIVFILGTYVLTAEVRQEAPWTIMCGGDIVFFGGLFFFFMFQDSKLWLAWNKLPHGTAVCKTLICSSVPTFFCLRRQKEPLLSLSRNTLTVQNTQRGTSSNVELINPSAD